MNTSVKALILEDTPDHAELIRMKLTRIPRCEVVVVDRMKDALDALTESSFDIMITDLNLPDSDRDQTIRVLKNVAPKLPLIVLTSDQVDPNGKDSIMLGAQVYLRKDDLATTQFDRLIFQAIERQKILNENMRLAEELNSKNKALEIAKGDAEEAMRVKAEFLTNMSHEIRTPLTSILGFIDVAIEAGGVDPESESAAALSTVKSNSDHLLALLNNILDVAKVDTRSVDLELMQCSVSEVLESSIKLISAQAQEKGLDLQGVVLEGTPEKLLIDPTRLRQILVNLIGNAVKFTNSGSVRVEVSSARLDSNCYWLTIQIVDTGIGLRVNELQKIQEFGSFSQANSSTNRRFGGSGLGLRISQGLAELMGGSIDIQSEFGVGSTFTLKIKAPRVGAEQTRICSGNGQEIESADLSGLRVLVTDDSADNCRLFGYYLKKCNATVENVFNGQESVDRLMNRSMPSVDMVLMDLQMPVLDGYSAFNELRKQGLQVPVFATSASTGVEDRTQVTQAGFTGFLAKPIDPVELITVAQQVLDMKDERSNAA